MSFLLLAAGALISASAVAVIVLLMTAAGGGLKVPDVVGESFGRAGEIVQSSGLSIEVDPLQDRSPVEDIDRLKVIQQDPKPGSRCEEGELVTVRLKGLPDGPLEGGSSYPESGAAAEPAPESAEPGENPPAAAGQAVQPQPAAPPVTGHVVCLDPGHSANSPSSEIDPATGLDVADNSGASGELEAMWELAGRTKARLEQMGFRVVLTKESAGSYASLRKRADIGNTCSIVVRLHYDPELQAILFPGEGQYKERGGNRVMVDPQVAAASGTLARSLAPFLADVGITRVANDMGGTSSNSGPAFVGSVLSRVPVVLVENDPGTVRDNPAGQDRVADALARGINAYFQGR